MDLQKIIRDALIHHGFSPAGADALIANYEANIIAKSGRRANERSTREPAPSGLRTEEE